MRYLLIALTFIFTTSCSNQKDTTALRKNQLEVMVIQKDVRVSKKNKKTVKEYYVKAEDKEYFIKFSEGYVTKLNLEEYLNQKIIIKGEVKTGKWETDLPGSISTGEESKPSRVGEYIVIYKIYH